MHRFRWSNVFLLFVSTVVALLLAEGIGRLSVNPLDVLGPKLVEHEILGHYIEPYSGGHDEWGFRNYSRPDSSTIVAIGDSQTWGINAPADRTYPYQLGEMLDVPVYNFGVSGYGPVHYQYLLKNKALELGPSLVVLGLYLGNDINDAYKLVYKKDYWANLRSDEFQRKYGGIPLDTYTIDKSFFYRARYWLSRNSVFFSLLKNSFAQKQNINERKGTDYVKYVNDSLGRVKFLNPESRLSVTDIDNPRTQEGLRISLQSLEAVKKICDSHQLNFLVVLIPSEIMVYANDLLRNEHLSSKSQFQKIVLSERKVKSILVEKLKKDEIPYLDLLSVLQKCASENIYPDNGDGHPTALGYEKIAYAIAEKIRSEEYIF